MEKEQVLSCIYLRAVLPLLEEVVGHDTEAANLIKGWKCSVMFHVSDGPAVTLKFRDGKCEASRRSMALPTIAMWFSSADKLNKMFEGANVIPVIWKGIWHPKILTNFIALTKRLDYYMKPSDQLLANKKDFDFIVRLMLYAALYGVKEVGENDEKMKSSIVSSIPNSTLQVVVGGGGPKAYLIKTAEGFIAGKGDAPGQVDAFMELKDVKAAYELFTGKTDAMAAIGTAEIRIRGLIPLVDGVSGLLDQLSKYLPA